MSDYKKSTAEWKRYNANRGWIGVDLDGTLAYHGEWLGSTHIGEPIPAMLERVLKWLAAGIEVRIMTARASEKNPSVTKAIHDWCLKHVGQKLRVTCEKDYQMLEQWDDRAVQVIPNTGMRADGEGEACCYDGLCPECAI